MSPGDLDDLLNLDGLLDLDGSRDQDEAPVGSPSRSSLGAASLNLLVGYETSDDAGVYRLDGDRALVVTADFITPVVDDAFTFGRVAAANSLSDIYAMGGVPLVALNLAGYPQQEVPAGILKAIFAGAAAVCAEADCVIGGGHTVRDSEVKFGLSVTGLVHPDRILRNSTARPGDRLVLTKPLGTGALIAANRAGQLTPDEYDALIECMTKLNRWGTLLSDLGATACTDVTGFGLTGHGLEMARGAGVQFVIETAALPCLPRATELCAGGFTCGGTKANARFTGPQLSLAADLDEGLIGLLHDPQTSGGLLIAVPPDRCDALQLSVLAAGAPCAVVIGEVREHRDGQPYLVCA